MREARSAISVEGLRGSSAPTGVLFVGLAVIQHLFAFAPWLIVADLYLFSWRGLGILGYWPQPVNPDPKYLAGFDLLSNILYLNVYPLFVLAHIAFVALPIFTIFLYRKYPRWWSLVLLVLFVTGFLVFRLDPGERFYWWLD
jgi:hypothetical protein